MEGVREVAGTVERHTDRDRQIDRDRNRQRHRLERMKARWSWPEWMQEG